jgi:glycosyltransferase involved in cell wall biosynthesis
MRKKYISGLVSIGLPTYNRADLLKRAIDSLLGQTYQNIELIISDNCSSDGTRKLCERYAAADSRVRYHRQNENIGIIANGLYVIKEARGEYYMWASDDDWWNPKFIELLKNSLDRNPEYGTAMSSLVREYTDGEWYDRLLFAGPNDLTKLRPEEVFYKMAFSRKPFQCVWWGLHRTEPMQKFMHRPWIKCERHDRVMAAELALVTRFYTLPDVLFKKTMHEISPIVRHAATYGSPSATWRHKRYFYLIGKKILLSELVPWHRKITFLPAYFRLAVMLIWKKTLLRKVPRQFKKLKAMILRIP